MIARQCSRCMATTSKREQQSNSKQIGTQLYVFMLLGPEVERDRG
jgi:hypothetical protein